MMPVNEWADLKYLAWKVNARLTIAETADDEVFVKLVQRDPAQGGETFTATGPTLAAASAAMLRSVVERLNIRAAKLRAEADAVSAIASTIDSPHENERPAVDPADQAQEALDATRRATILERASRVVEMSGSGKVRRPSGSWVPPDHPLRSLVAAVSVNAEQGEQG